MSLLHTQCQTQLEAILGFLLLGGLLSAFFSRLPASSSTWTDSSTSPVVVSAAFRGWQGDATTLGADLHDLHLTSWPGFDDLRRGVMWRIAIPGDVHQAPMPLPSSMNAPNGTTVTLPSTMEPTVLLDELDSKILQVCLRPREMRLRCTSTSRTPDLDLVANLDDLTDGWLIWFQESSEM